MHYQVKAIGDAPGVVALSIDAADEIEAKNQAEKMGYRVLALRAQRQRWRPSKDRDGFSLALFSQELLALLSAGLTLVEAAETLAEKEQRPGARQILERIIAQLYQGLSLSAAMEQHPAQFPALYVATVRASEKTGALEEALSRYIAYQSQMDILRKKIASAAIYPVVLLIAGGLVTFFLLAYVIPKFSRIYEDIGGNLPVLSQWLMLWGRLLEAHGKEVLTGFVLAVAAFGYAVTRPATRSWVLLKLWQIPAIGERMRVYQLARFYRTVGMLLRGGTPVVTALGMVKGLLASAMQERLDRATVDVREGRSISHAMESHALTTPVAMRMLRVGERSGKMGEMMERIAAFYDDEMARWIDWITKLIEPLLMAVIGLVIGVIVILMYFPIFELAGSIQ